MFSSRSSKTRETTVSWFVEYSVPCVLNKGNGYGKVELDTDHRSVAQCFNTKKTRTFGYFTQESKVCWQHFCVDTQVASLLDQYGGFLKWWYPTTIGFPIKNDHFGVFWGYPHIDLCKSYQYFLQDIQAINSMKWVPICFFCRLPFHSTKKGTRYIPSETHLFSAIFWDPITPSIKKTIGSRNICRLKNVQKVKKVHSRGFFVGPWFFMKITRRLTSSGKAKSRIFLLRFVELQGGEKNTALPEKPDSSFTDMAAS